MVGIFFRILYSKKLTLALVSNTPGIKRLYLDAFKNAGKIKYVKGKRDSDIKRKFRKGLIGRSASPKGSTENENILIISIKLVFGQKTGYEG